MKKQLFTLVLWTVVFYHIFGPLKEWGETGDLHYLYRWALGKKEFLLVTSTLIAFMGYTLGAYLSFYYTYPKKKFVLGIFLFLLCIPLAITFRYVLQEIVIKAIWGFGNYTDGYERKAYFFDNLYYAFVFTSFGVIVFFLRYSRYQEQQRLDYEIENQKTQLSLLRSQLNPHFLFNALNNIYALVYENNGASLEAIEKLSSLLRYSLYEKSEVVSLEKEWHFIENYIELESLRLPFTPAILLDVPPCLPPIEIPPFSLITFVENAFKHGELQDPENPVRIQIIHNYSEFIFNIDNKIAHKEKDDQGGIGLENLKKRLAIFYQQKHQLVIKKKKDQFSVTFKIPRALC